jgi:hypothetical protein
MTRRRAGSPLLRQATADSERSLSLRKSSSTTFKGCGGGTVVVVATGEVGRLRRPAAPPSGCREKTTVKTDLGRPSFDAGQTAPGPRRQFQSSGLG